MRLVRGHVVSYVDVTCSFLRDGVRMPDMAKSTLDLQRIEYAVVCLRNRLHFRLQTKDLTFAAKIFCLGPAKTGTLSLHKMFSHSGLRSAHQSGNWNTRDFDCFSDRGDYRPFDLYDQTYPNAQFVLNCRGLRNYLQSLGTHLQMRLPDYVGKGLRPQYFINQALRRHQHHLNVLRYFRERENLLVVNIERAGAMDFVADRLDLRPLAQSHLHKTTLTMLDLSRASLQTAIDRLGLIGADSDPLLLPNRLPSDYATLLPPTERVWL